MYELFQTLSELLEVNDCLTGDIALGVLKKEVEDIKVENVTKNKRRLLSSVWATLGPIFPVIRLQINKKKKTMV